MFTSPLEFEEFDEAPGTAAIGAPFVIEVEELPPFAD
jgi:hypothetical protein